MFKNYQLTLDIATGEARHPLIQVNTNDLESFKVSLILTQNRVPVDLTGKTVRIVILKPDKNTVLQDCEVTDAENGKAEVVLDTQAYVVSGKHYAEVMIYEGENRVAVTGRFVYNANKGILNDGTVESTTEWQSIHQAIADAREILTDLRENGTGVDSQARKDLEKVTADLAQSVQRYQQPDFVSMLNKNKSPSTKVGLKILGENSIETRSQIGKDVYEVYTITKDTNDDFLKLMNGRIDGVSNQLVEFGSDYDSVDTPLNGTGYNYYTNVVGNKIYKNYIGSNFDIHYFSDTRGGVWKVTVDGIDAGTFSTHINAQTDNLIWSTQNLYKHSVTNIENGEHDIVLEFMGDDTNNPPSSGAGTARGWIRYGNIENEDPRYFTFKITGITSDYGTLFPIFVPGSNKEFAFSCKPFGSTEVSEWIPQHYGIGSAFGETEIFVDGELLTDFTPTTTYAECERIEVLQKLKGYHSSELKPLMELTLSLLINNQGITLQGHVEFLQQTEIFSGYVMMFPVTNEFSTLLHTSFSNEYDATAMDGTDTDLVEKNQAVSYAFTNKTDELKKDYAIAMTITNPVKTFRMGQEGTRENLVWLQHRTDGTQKLYPQVYHRHVADVGETLNFSGKWTIGKLADASKLIV